MTNEELNSYFEQHEKLIDQLIIENEEFKKNMPEFIANMERIDEQVKQALDPIY